MYSSSVFITDEALNCILHLFFLQMEALLLLLAFIAKLVPDHVLFYLTKLFLFSYHSSALMPQLHLAHLFL